MRKRSTPVDSEAHLGVKCKAIRDKKERLFCREKWREEAGLLRRRMYASVIANRKRRSSVARTITAAAIVLLLTSVSRASGPGVTVGPNVRVSKVLPDTGHTECVVAADPNHRDRLLAASMYYPKGSA